MQMCGRAAGILKTARSLAWTDRGEKGAGAKVRNAEPRGVDMAGSWKSSPAFTLWVLGSH